MKNFHYFYQVIKSFLCRPLQDDEQLTSSDLVEFREALCKHNSRFKPKALSDYIIWGKPFIGAKHRAAKYHNLRKYLTLDSSLRKCNAIAAWGLKRKTLNLFSLAVKHNKPFLLLEDGFIRSLYPWAADVDKTLNAGISFCIDRKGFYYDGNLSTDLEDLLNTKILNEAEIIYAKQMIGLIVRNRISKYNNQPLNLNELATKSRKRVLVVDQSYGDMSLVCGGVDDSVFQRMVQDAVKENPDAEILFKIHPDTLSRCTESGFSKFIPASVKVIDTFINPITLLQSVDEVYVATSQLGFEALMCGKKVHVYGLPFYSGWGLTDDKIHCPRRKRKLTIYELFYIVYVSYSHYIDPETGVETNVEGAINYILKHRKELLGQ